jgi:alkyl hydroperoxide reductase subunit AhpC
MVADPTELKAKCWNRLRLVGRKAPEFTADAFDRGEVRKVSLSEYRGRWVMLFFYPADFSTV